MKELYLIRHGETNKTGHLTSKARKDAVAIADLMPLFNRVYSSKIEAAGITAKLISKQEPTLHDEIGYYFPEPDKEHLIFSMMHAQNISYLAAAQRLGDPQFMANIETKAHHLNEFIDDRLEKTNFNSTILIVTDAVIIGEAMLQRNIPIELIPFLRGYVIKENGSISRFMPPLN
jgi:hypothetical protein